MTHTAKCWPKNWLAGKTCGSEAVHLLSTRNCFCFYFNTRLRSLVSILALHFKGTAHEISIYFIFREGIVG